jgi:hypothetical protein
VAGWTALPRGDPWRGRLAAMALAAVAGLAAGIPGDVRHQDRFQAFTDGLARAQDDLERAIDSERVRPLAGREGIRTTDHRAVPLLSLWLDRPPGDIATLDWGPPDAPLVFAYTDRFEAYRLAVPRRVQPELEPGRTLYSGDTWTVYLRPTDSASTRKLTERDAERRPSPSSAVTVSR